MLVRSDERVEQASHYNCFISERASLTNGSDVCELEEWHLSTGPGFLRSQVVTFIAQINFAEYVLGAD